MRVKCISNNLRLLDPRLVEFAYGQNSEGAVELVVGKVYSVFGIRKNDLGTFLLVVKSEHETLPWWMPADLFTVVDHRLPQTWSKEFWTGFGDEEVQANPIYFNAAEDIEDGTENGYKVFTQMQAEVMELDDKPVEQ